MGNATQVPPSHFPEEGPLLGLQPGSPVRAFELGLVSNQFPISANHMCLPISPTMVFLSSETEQAEAEFRRLDPKDIMKVMNEFVASRARKYAWDAFSGRSTRNPCLAAAGQRR